MKDTYYFSHDYNPTSDPKIQALIGEHGAVGYGVYWRIVEMLHEDNNHKLELKKYMFIALAKQMSTNVEQVQVIVEDCINVYELFCSDKSYFWSERVMRNIEKRIELSDKRSKAGKISAENRKKSTHVEQMSTHVEQNPTKERKGKEIKEKEINNRDKLYGEFVSQIPDPNWSNLIFDWLSYKAEIKDYYKSTKSLEAMFQNLKSLSGNSFETAKEIVNQSIANNWKGLFEIKNNNGSPKQQNNTSGFTRQGYDPNNGIGSSKELLSSKKRPVIF